MPRPDSSPSAALIARAVLRLGRRLRAARPEGSLNLSALALLATLHRLGAMPAARLAREENLKPQSLSRILAVLSAEGLVQRRRDPADGRAILIEMTPAGRAALGRDMAARRAWLDQAMEMALDADERQRLAEAAVLMLKVAGQEAADADAAATP